MNKLVFLLVVALTGLFASGAVAVPPPDRATAAPAVLDYTSYINANNILMFMTNDGVLGRDLGGVFRYDAGFFYPYTSNEDIISGANANYLVYSCGLWIGGVDAFTGDTLMALAEYSTEYVPGPTSGIFDPDAYINPAYRVYKLYSDSMADNPNTDYVDWPVSQGAPVCSDGSPMLVGDQTTWAVYNDLDPNQHQNNAGETDPLGLEIQQAVFAFDNSELEDVVFIRYKILNKGARFLDDVVLSMWCDPDLGEYRDDLVGCDTLLSTGFVYNSDNDDAGHYGSTPPALGLALLQGPKIHTGDPVDTAHMWGQVHPGYKNLPMTSFAKYINGTDPDNYQETFRCMNGLTQSGDPYYYAGEPLAFQLSGNPVLGTGDLDSGPSDRRFMLSTGLIQLSPGDSTEIVLAAVVGHSTNRLASLAEMLHRVDRVNDLSVWPSGEDTPVNLVQWTEAEGGNDHWYAVVPSELFWDEAHGLAGTLELDTMVGYLATVTSMAENQFIVNHVVNDLVNPSILDQYWLGGQDIGGQWEWITGEPWEYTNWTSGEPNNAGEETALGMWGPSGMWNNSLPNDDVNDLHRFWSVVEWGQSEVDSVINVIKWPTTEGGNDHWYAVVPFQQHWDEAHDLAGALELDGKAGYLATVTSASESQFIVEHVVDGLVNPSILDQYWLGGQDVGGQWGWITGELWEYTNWTSGEPNNPGVETALGMWGPSGMWNNSLPNDDVNDLHRFWSVVEWGDPTLVVDIDILPGACPNNMAVMPFYRVFEEEMEPLAASLREPTIRSLATFTVAILGSDEVDVTTIDPLTIKWERLSPLSWSYVDAGTPNEPDAETCDCNEDGPDGQVDLVMEFRRFFAILAPPEVRIGDNLPMDLTGTLFDGQPIIGKDCIVLKGKSWTETAFDPVSSQPRLLGNYPNPFNPSTEIVFSLPAASDVKLEVFNLLGQKVRTLVDGRMGAGAHTVSWDSRGSSGCTLASGIYLYRIQIGEFTQTRKMMLVK